MKYFFIAKNIEVETIALDMVNTLPGRLYLTLNEKDRAKVIPLLQEYVNYVEEEPKTFVTKAYDSVMDKLDLESK